MPPERFVCSVDLRAPLDAVFGFHQRPDALQQLVPPWERVTVLQPPVSLEVGTRVILRLQILGPLGVTWIAEHTVYEPPRRFVDRSVQGPFKSWVHEHRFDPLPDGGTRLTDDVRYELPAGRLGNLVGGGIARRKIERMFAWRHEATRRACEGDGTAIR